MTEPTIDRAASPTGAGKRIAVMAALLVAAAVLLPDAAALAQVTLRGRVFYNDLRKLGRFALREDPSGAPGTKLEHYPGARNYLAGLDIVADIYEIDPFVPQMPSCIPLHHVGTATVGFDGVWEKTLNGSEGCTAEDDNVFEFAVVFRLRVCSTVRCFSIEDDDLLLYRLEHPDAGFLNPVQVPPGSTRTLADFNFEKVPEDIYSMAANLYASMVDTTRVLHVVHDIPDRRDEFGEVRVRFPSSIVDVAKTTSSSRIQVPAFNKWPNGKAMMHEYGHIVHRRAWDGSTGSCSDYDPGESYNRDNDDDTWCATCREWPTPAFREGWANYVQRITVEDGTGGSCSGSGFDINRDLSDLFGSGSPIANADPDEYPDTLANVTHPGDGKSYPRNVTKLLCDWSDAVGDDDPNMDGDGDHFAASVYSTWLNLDLMWDWVADRDCLTICDYVDYYVNGRMGPWAVGQSTHETYEALIADLTFNNGMSCGLPNPTTLP